MRFLGGVPEAELPWLYNAAELFVFPSLHEGFGLPLLEAMACGAPAACSNRSSLPEIGGPAVLTFDPENEGEIAGAILRLLRDEEERRARSALSLEQARNFSWERTAALTAGAYRRLLRAVRFDTPPVL